MEADIEVSFKAFRLPEGNGVLDIRIIIPKNEYMLVAEDSGCYYIQPIVGMTKHVEATPNTDNRKDGSGE